MLRWISSYTPQNKHGTWKWILGKGDSYWKPPFPGSMLIFGGVSIHNCLTKKNNLLESHSHSVSGAPGPVGWFQALLLIRSWDPTGPGPSGWFLLGSCQNMTVTPWNMKATARKINSWFTWEYGDTPRKEGRKIIWIQSIMASGSSC